MRAPGCKSTDVDLDFIPSFKKLGVKFWVTITISWFWSFSCYRG